MSTTKVKQDKRAGVWMDHQFAHVVYRNDDGEYVVDSLETGFIPWGEIKSRDRDHETRKNHREIEGVKAFYKKLQKKLMGYNHILITGPTTARTEFIHHLQKARSFTGKRIAEEKVNAMTERQLIAYMKKKLGKPMDIFREEEIV